MTFCHGNNFIPPGFVRLFSQTIQSLPLLVAVPYTVLEADDKIQGLLGSGVAFRVWMVMMQFVGGNTSDVSR